MKTVDELRIAIVKEFSSKWELNDSGHRIEHFSEVEKCGLLINDRLGLGYDPKLIMLVSYFHDLFAWSRENHHVMSGFWIETSKHPVLEGLSYNQIQLVADACREHRASYKGVYSHEFSMLMSAADRGLPGRVEAMLDRAIRYRMDRGLDAGNERKSAIEHLKEKFGSKGYARYPSLYEAAFKEDLELQRKAIDAL